MFTPYYPTLYFCFCIHKIFFFFITSSPFLLFLSVFHLINSFYSHFFVISHLVIFFLFVNFILSRVDVLVWSLFLFFLQQINGFHLLGFIFVLTKFEYICKKVFKPTDKTNVNIFVFFS